MEKVKKHFIIVSEDNHFDNFINDKNVKKYIISKLTWMNSMFIKLSEDTPDDTLSYILLKYGDIIKDTSSIVTDRTPIMYVDYLPKEENKFTKYIYENQRNSKRR